MATGGGGREQSAAVGSRNLARDEELVKMEKVVHGIVASTLGGIPLERLESDYRCCFFACGGLFLV